jgi:mono/diheme cytochrome c family protein
VLAAATTRNVGLVIAAIVGLGVTLYLVFNVLRARPEVGSELELAPNRKPYYDDAELEGRVLNRGLFIALGCIVVLAVGLPLYWLGEPARSDGQQARFDRQARDRGEILYGPPSEEHPNAFNCAACHGPEGEGGVAPHTITDEDGNFVAQVDWRAPALNTVLLRYSKEEVRYVITYGRTFSPMPPWGIEGGGPMNEQQIGNIIAFLESIQLTPEEAQEAATAEVERSLEEGEFDTAGEAVFNMGLESGFAGGAYSCGRCHTQGWSYGDVDVPGGGALGPNLHNVRGQFPGGAAGFALQLAFVGDGSVNGEEYGAHGQGSGRMPGFSDMLTEEQLRAVVEYERSLDDSPIDVLDEPPEDEAAQ